MWFCLLSVLVYEAEGKVDLHKTEQEDGTDTPQCALG
jgi:hypothetical protein